jgi:transmembrane sensor
MEEIDTIISKYLTEEITPAEADLLEKWRAESVENQRYFEQMKLVWQRIPAVKNSFPRPINVAAALAKTKSKIQLDAPEFAPKKLSVSFRNWGLAIAAAILAIVAAVLFFPKNAENQPIELATATETRQAILADGSTISINHSSKIRTNFSKKTRQVELSGEAYFKIEPNPEKPFIISVQNVEITVVGTAFNVDNLTDKTRVIVRVNEGKVRVKSGDKTIDLTVGEQAIFDEKTGQFLTTKMAEKTAANDWFDRRFDFDEIPLSEVIPVLEHAYNVRISLINKELGNCKLRTRFSNEPIERILEVLSETFSLTISKRDSGYYLDGVGCE